MRFHTRAFLFSFFPFACLLAISFFLVQHFVQINVRSGLRNSLSQTQRTVAVMRDLNNFQNREFLQALGNERELPAELRTLLENSQEPLARQALEGHLLELATHSGIDVMIVAPVGAEPLAGVVRDQNSLQFDPLFAFPEIEDGGLLLFRGEPFQTATVPLQLDGAKVGSLTIGKKLNLSTFATDTVLVHGGVAVQSNLPNVSDPQLGFELADCKANSECSVQIAGNEWMSLPILEGSKRAGWRLYSLVNVDESLAPVGVVLRKTFLTVTFLTLVITLFCSLVSSRAIVHPLAAMVEQLRQTAVTGNITEFSGELPRILEIEDLASSYNHAAGSVREGHDKLRTAYLEFVYSLARALDARDKYTAGHSERVSDIACAIATAMGQDHEDVERLRIGALLHDIGKMGISDALLQKPGRLTDDEFNVIRKHPVIGRRILKGVQGFSQYLPAVELHHENWDGTGYPHRQRGDETPLDARIIHVADAYDAMTTNRSYRQAMTHSRAMDILADNAGTQFDPEVVAALQRAVSTSLESTPEEEMASMDQLSHRAFEQDVFTHSDYDPYMIPQ